MDEWGPALASSSDDLMAYLDDYLENYEYEDVESKVWLPDSKQYQKPLILSAILLCVSVGFFIFTLIKFEGLLRQIFAFKALSMAASLSLQLV